MSLRPPVPLPPRVLFPILLLLLLLLLSYPALADTVTAPRRRHGVVALRPHVRRQDDSAVHPVLGVRGLGVNTTAPRLEIRELVRDADLFNLYLLGLRAWMATAQEERFSYFQVAGIHGRPFVPWDGVPGRPQPEEGYKEGYCHHSSNLFPTWHRPFLALVEEWVVYHARAVVAGFPEGEFKARMAAALPSLRLPFWDAAAVPPVGTGSYPWSVQRKTIDVELPDGVTTIPNPLYSYTFQPIPSKALFGKLPWTHWPTTLRYPTSKWADAQSQDSKIASQLDLNLANLRQRTYQMMALQKDYHNISNNMVSLGGVLDSLESIHDTIHNTVGSSGPGHMTNAAYSAFDPVFWLLHANIDRMTAIWQALNPHSWVTNHSNPTATFTSEAGAYADENTPLHPFHRSPNADFWTSATVRDHTVFGYTYPELVNLTEHDTLIRRINNLYGTNATSQFSWQLRDPLPASKPHARRSITLPSPQNTTHHYHYYANIRVPKSPSTAGGYKVFVFAGPTRAATNGSAFDATAWMRDPSFVGFTGFQSMGAYADGFAAAGGEAGEANGVVALTGALEDRFRAGLLDGFGEEEVGAYLRENMKWRITTPDHVIVLPDDTPGFHIAVSYALVKPATPDTFPEVLGGFQSLALATGGAE